MQQIRLQQGGPLSGLQRASLKLCILMRASLMFKNAKGSVKTIARVLTTKLAAWKQHPINEELLKRT